MELPSKFLEQIAHNTTPKMEEHLLIVMDKSTREEHLSQPLQTDKKLFKSPVTFLISFNGNFNVTNSSNNFYSKKTITEGDDFIQITIPPGDYEIESLNIEVRRIINDEEHFTESDYQFQINPRFSKLGCIMESSPQGPTVSFVFDDGIRNLLGFLETILYNENILSPNLVDILSFVNIFLECDIAKGMIYNLKRSGITHNWTMTVNPGYKDVELLTGGNAWYMMETKDTITSIFQI